MALKTSERPVGTVIYTPEDDAFSLKTVNGWVIYRAGRETLSDEDMPSWTPNENVLGTVKT
jgi:hypothetical protein